MAFLADPIFWGNWRDLTFARRTDPNVSRWGYLGAWYSMSVDQKRRLLRGLLEGSPASAINGAHRVYVTLAQQFGNTETSLIRAADEIARAIDADNLRRVRLGIPVPGAHASARPPVSPIRFPRRAIMWPLPAGQAVDQPTGWSNGLKVLAAIELASVAASTYHGYKRTGSVGWALAWGAAGSIAPIITPTIAVAQGFAKPEHGKRRK